MKPRHKRIALIVAGLSAIGIATALVLNAFQSNLVFFFTPSQISAGEAPLERTFRVGGMVERGSLKRQRGELAVQFVITDTVKTIRLIRASCPTCSVKEKGLLFKDGWTVPASFAPRRCWPSTTRTTCHPRPSMHWTRPRRIQLQGSLDP